MFCIMGRVSKNELVLNIKTMKKVCSLWIHFQTPILSLL